MQQGVNPPDILKTRRKIPFSKVGKLPPQCSSVRSKTILQWVSTRPVDVSLNIKQLNYWFSYQETTIIDQAMPAAGYAYANLGKQIKKLEEYRPA